jgi:hypothetical protein
MGRSCRPFGEQIRFACAACCWCQGARIAVATCAMPFSTCLKRDANGGALPKDFETRLIPPPRRSRCTAAVCECPPLRCPWTHLNIARNRWIYKLSVDRG